MTKTEFKEAFKIALDSTIDLSNVDNDYLFGCGLRDFFDVHGECGLRLTWSAKTGFSYSQRAINPTAGLRRIITSGPLGIPKAKTIQIALPAS